MDDDAAGTRVDCGATGTRVEWTHIVGVGLGKLTLAINPNRQVQVGLDQAIPNVAQGHWMLIAKCSLFSTSENE